LQFPKVTYIRLIAVSLVQRLPYRRLNSPGQQAVCGSKLTHFEAGGAQLITEEVMRSKVLACALGLMFFALCSVAKAQQPGKIPRIGYGNVLGKNVRFVTFTQGLRDIGYIEGKNIAIEFRSTEGRLDRIPDMVNELVRLKPDVLVLSGQPAVRLAKKATSTIPIVIVASFDPVATGIVNSLARPGGNITGLTTLDRELSGKRLELLKEVKPGITRLGVLLNPDTPGPHQSFKEYESAAHALKIQLQSLEVRSPTADFEAVLNDATKARVHALITARNSVLDRNRNRIADLAIKLQVPSMCERELYVEAGCLMSYSTDEEWNYRRAATYVDKILKGAKPADLPIEQPTKFELVINLKTAKQIGLTIPQSVLYRADKVIR
jgi:putative ABC transport system substrate-binding protein